MSASLKTENFELPKYAGEDATSWLVDFNGAMDKIDTALKGHADNLITDGSDIDNLEKSVETTLETVNSISSSVAKLSSNVNANTENLKLVNTHLNEQDVKIDETNQQLEGTDSQVLRLSNNLAEIGKAYQDSTMISKVQFLTASAESVNLYKKFTIGNIVIYALDFTTTTTESEYFNILFKELDEFESGSDYNIFTHVNINDNSRASGSSTARTLECSGSFAEKQSPGSKNLNVCFKTPSTNHAVKVRLLLIFA